MLRKSRRSIRYKNFNKYMKIDLRLSIFVIIRKEILNNVNDFYVELNSRVIFYILESSNLFFFKYVGILIKIGYILSYKIKCN